MNLFDVTLQSLRRQKGKKSMLALAMALCVCVAIVLYSSIESQRRQLEQQFDEYGANIVVVPRSDDLSLSYGGINLTGIVTNIREIRAEEVERIYQIPNKQNIRAVSPKLLGTGFVSVHGVSTDAMIVGVDFEEEKKIKAWWALDGAYPVSNREIVAGSRAAAVLGLSVGSRIVINDREFTVSGVLDSTGGQDDAALLAPMALVEQLLEKPGRVSLVEVSALCVDCPIDELVSQIAAVLPDADVQAVRQVMEQRMQVVRQFGRFGAAILGVLVVLCGLFVFSTVSGSVAERRHEIGIMRAIGFSGAHIARVILTESAIIGIFSGILGVVAAIPIQNTLVPLLAGTAPGSVPPIVILAGFTAIVVVAIGSSVVPASLAARIDPVTAIAGL